MLRALRRLRPALLFAVVALATACASTGSGTSGRFGPGDTFEYEGTGYKLLQVEQDYVLMRHRSPDGEAGAISGYVDEVLRVPRSRLGEGRWVAGEKMPGVSLQWLGLDSFSLVRDGGAAEEPAAPEVVQAEPEATGR